MTLSIGQVGEFSSSVSRAVAGTAADLSSGRGGDGRFVLAAVGADEAQMRRASKLADDASRHFDEVMPGLTGAKPAAPAVRLAQATTPKQQPSAQAPASDDFLAPVWDWLERAQKQYQDVIVKPLSEGGPAEAPVTKAPAPKAPTTVATPPPAKAPVVTVPATPPAPKAPVVAQQPTVVPSAPSAPVVTAQAKQPAAPEKDIVEQIQDNVQGWLERANREYQSVIVKRLSDPDTVDKPVMTATPTTPPRAPGRREDDAADAARAAGRRGDAACAASAQGRAAEVRRRGRPPRRAAEA